MDDLSRTQPFGLNSAATTNATLVNAGPTQLRSLVLTNTGGAAAFVKLYDKATAPTVGTDVPALTIPVAANGVVTLPLGEHGLTLRLGLALAVTNLGTDADTTAVAAGQVKVRGGFVT